LWSFLEPEMSENYPTTRRAYLKAAGVTGVAGATGLFQFAGTAHAQQGQPIQMGSILPITGDLSAYGSGMQQAVNLAVRDINNAGGPLDRQINVNNKDSQTQPSVSIQKYNSLVNENNIIGFVGAASSGVSVPLAENVADDQVMEMSNASTSPVLATLGYNQDESVKYFGRTAPNDAQQGIVMGKILSDQQYVGAQKAAFLFVNNPYGKGLADRAKQSFTGETVGMVPYDQRATDYTSTLDQLFNNDPDAIGFIGYPGNGKTILNQWNDGGYGGQWVLSEGLNSESFLTDLSNVTAGMYISSPDPQQTGGAKAFQQEIGQANTLFAPHAYDAMFLMALAIQKAGEASGTAIAENIRDVSRFATGGGGGGGGNATQANETAANVTAANATAANATAANATTAGNATQGNETAGGGTTETQPGVVTVNQFGEAKQLLSEGTDINYQGASSPVDLNESLEPLNQFAILQVQQDGSTQNLETIPQSFFQGKL